MAPVVRRAGVALRRKPVQPHSLRWNAARALAASAILVVLTSSLFLTSASAAPPEANNVYRVAGNEFVAPGGKQFIPYGFVIYCLAMKSLRCEHPTRHDPNTDIDRIRAAASFWHADAVRIQVAPEHLFHRGVVESSYVSVLDGEIQLANKLGMVAIVTDQTEEFKGPPLPTSSAVRFWRYMAAHYAGNRRVFFDLYNEPRLKPTSGEHWMWNLWRNGGTATVKGVTDHFVGMQRLVDVIRHAGAANVIIAEGNQGDHDLSLVRHYLLSGTNIAYGIEPDLTANDQTPVEWAKNWGDLSDELPIAMEAFQDWPSASVCNPRSPRLLPQLLDYLREKRLGLIVWSLEGGQMIVGTNLRKPTTFRGTSSYRCGNTGLTIGGRAHDRGYSGARAGQRPERNRIKEPPVIASADVGPGQDVLGFFRTMHSHGVVPQSPTSAGGPVPWSIAGSLGAIAVLFVGGVVLRRRRRSVHGAP